MNEREPRDEPGADELCRTAHLLELARAGPGRAVDLLIEDLEAHPGGGRLEALLAAGPAAALVLPNRAASLEELIELKERCVRAGEGERLEVHIQRLAGYFATVAAALVHHKRRITSRPMEKLEPVLLDLAAVAGSPWSELFEEAASAHADDEA